MVLVDGLGAQALSPTGTPALWAMSHGDARGRLYGAAESVMPAVTTTNHASVATGVYPAAHGITGNAHWDRDTAESAPLNRADRIEVETVFTTMRRRAPALRSAAILGKSKLAELFGDGGGERAPNRLWGDAASDAPATAPGSDARTMDEVMETLVRDDPSFVLVNLGDVDRTSHVFGPQSPEAAQAVFTADRQIARLVQLLEARGTWEHTVLIVSADHGLYDVPRSEPPPYLVLGDLLDRHGITGVAVVSHGGMASIYLRDLDARAPAVDAGGAARLKAARDAVLAEPAVEEALYRLPNAADGGAAHTLDAVHPEWRLSHPRIGELVVVARGGFFFAEPFSGRPPKVRGSHGSPTSGRVPLLVTGGHPRLRPGMTTVERRVAAPDLGMTARWLLGLPRPRYGSGALVPPRLAGRVLKDAFLPVP